MPQTTFGTTFTSGIQDIAAFLPILGTDQCKSHVGAALDRGYLYAAATPLSMFGCLGIVQASVGILLTSASSLTARMVRDAGFTLQGSTASLIERTPVGSPVKFAVETRFKELRAQYGLEDAELELEQSFKWNALLLITTFFFSFLGFTPYVPIIISDRSFSPVTVWIFPWLRIMGSAVCVIAAQFAIQCRIIIILRSTRQLSDKPSISDLEKSPRISRRAWKKDSDTLYLIISQLFLVLGIIATAVGYLGCFTLVQNTKSLNAILWLSLEATLCLLRVLIWGWNPHFDANTQVTVKISLSDAQPEPTTTQSYEDDIQRENQPFLVETDRSFLNRIALSVGPVERFNHPDQHVAIYYTLLHEDTDYTLLTTVLNLETRSIFVVETKRSILPDSSMNDPSPAYAASFVPSHSKGTIQVQCLKESFYIKDNTRSTGLEYIHQHSQLLISLICGVDRKDSLVVRWDFRSSFVELSQDAMLCNLALDMMVSKSHQDQEAIIMRDNQMRDYQNMLEIFRNQSLRISRGPRASFFKSQTASDPLGSIVATGDGSDWPCDLFSNRFTSDLHNQTLSNGRSALPPSHSLLVHPLQPPPPTSTLPSPSVPQAQAHPLVRPVGAFV
ncbi:hypothetical protein BDP27DRAFT_1327245 [Rhodocollybia butyracea]|uniref:Uncharacterized protein n=1 Tax=Rhodocollybia butyracea TaxID=206335 RepID=A0A9P5PM91_9AGAR|nr:hypothetical protein BDP27DRAFT_1327245 [Rhodocollybia butyracea]